MITSLPTWRDDANSASDPVNSSVFRWCSDTARELEREGRTRDAQSMRRWRWNVLETSRQHDRRQAQGEV